MFVRFVAPAWECAISHTLCPANKASAASIIVGTGRYGELSHAAGFNGNGLGVVQEAIQDRAGGGHVAREFAPFLQGPPKTFSSYFAAFFLVGFVFDGLAFAVFFAALASAISANTFSIRRI